MCKQPIEHSVFLTRNLSFRIKYKIWMRLNLVNNDGQKRFTDWSNVPYVNRWDDSNRKFNLNSNDADNANDKWSSPVVRDCSI